MISIAVPYKIISAEQCEDSGWNKIKSKTQCEEAVIALPNIELPNIGVMETPNDKFPPGCIYSRDARQVIWNNVAEKTVPPSGLPSVTVPISEDIPCGTAYFDCICRTGMCIIKVSVEVIKNNNKIKKLISSW